MARWTPKFSAPQRRLLRPSGWWAIVAILWALAVSAAVIGYLWRYAGR